MQQKSRNPVALGLQLPRTASKSSFKILGLFWQSLTKYQMFFTGIWNSGNLLGKYLMFPHPSSYTCYSVRCTQMGCIPCHQELSVSGQEGHHTTLIPQYSGVWFLLNRPQEFCLQSLWHCDCTELKWCCVCPCLPLLLSPELRHQSCHTILTQPSSLHLKELEKVT